MPTQTFDAPPKAAPKKRVTKKEKQAEQIAHARRVTAELLTQIKEWIAPLPGWQISQQEPERGHYGAMSANRPIITILDTPKGRLILEPLDISFGGRAVVDFWAYPASYNVRLLHDLSEDGTWRVLTNSGIYLHEEWNRDNFLRLAHDLLHADWE